MFVTGMQDLRGAAAASEPCATVDIYDYTNLDRKLLDGVAAALRDILASTLPAVEVRLCRGAGAQQCEGRTPAAMAIRIVEASGTPPGTLGTELLGHSYASADGGTYASVFLAAIREEASVAGVPWQRVLSCAAAHEVGHMVLGARAHTAHGLMKARWERTDYVAIAQGQFARPHKPR